MILSRILSKKNIISIFATKMTDLIHNTFSFPNEVNGSGIAAVGEYENMRPDLVANRLYGDISKWDAILKYNGISNPFSIKSGDILYVLPFASLESVYVSPRIMSERGEKVETDVNGGLIGDNIRKKDKSRIENLANKNSQREAGKISTGKNGALPPNISKPGDKSVKVKDGRLIFGEDVTTVNKDNCPVPISRARLQAALLKDKLFL
jgi:hypothetical protein